MHSNERLIKSISQNLSKTKALQELVLCGIHMNKTSVQLLVSGLEKAKCLNKLMIHFCISKRDTLTKLIPVLSNPNLVPIEELSLMANGLTDRNMGELVSKIIVGHFEARDVVQWKYGLRNEQAPSHELLGLKSLDLSFNKLGAEAAKALSLALKHDRYLRSLDLRHNQFSNSDALSILESLKNN